MSTHVAQKIFFSFYKWIFGKVAKSIGFGNHFCVSLCIWLCLLSNLVCCTSFHNFIFLLVYSRFLYSEIIVTHGIFTPNSSLLFVPLLFNPCSLFPYSPLRYWYFYVIKQQQMLCHYTYVHSNECEGRRRIWFKNPLNKFFNTQERDAKLLFRLIISYNKFSSEFSVAFLCKKIRINAFQITNINIPSKSVNTIKKSAW